VYHIIKIYSAVFVLVLLTKCTSKGHNNVNNINLATKASGNHRQFSSFRIVVYHHPKEMYYPMDPAEFIRHSSLRHHTSFRADSAFNKKTRNWQPLNPDDSSFYNIPADQLARHKIQDNKNCRPNDKNCSSYNVYLESKSNLAGEKNASGIVPAATYILADGRKQYWLFYGYDYSSVLGLNFSHQGDWESVTLDIKNQAIEGAWLSAHGVDIYYKKRDLQIVTEGHTQTLLVYSARGTHAMYNKPGDFHILNTDHTSAAGTQWVITDLEIDLKKQPWREFAGAWGTVGHIAPTTGPLGPLFKIIKERHSAGKILI
jgi:hypothetical protein